MAPSVDELRAGSRFGTRVAQYYARSQPYLPERRVRKAWLPGKLTGRQGRIDALLIVNEPERSAMIVEAKNSDWDAIAGRGTVRRNVLRHIRQVWSYLNGVLITDDGPTDLSTIDAAYAALVYPRAPSEPTRALVEEICGEQFITVIWFDELPPPGPPRAA